MTEEARHPGWWFASRVVLALVAVGGLGAWGQHTHQNQAHWAPAQVVDQAKAASYLKARATDLSDATISVRVSAPKTAAVSTAAVNVQRLFVTTNLKPSTMRFAGWDGDTRQAIGTFEFTVSTAALRTAIPGSIPASYRAKRVPAELRITGKEKLAGYTFRAGSTTITATITDGDRQVEATG